MEKRFDYIHIVLLSGIVILSTLLFNKCEKTLIPTELQIDQKIEVNKKEIKKINYKKHKPTQLDSVITKHHPGLVAPKNSDSNDSIYCIPSETAKIIIENDVKSFFQDSIIAQMELKHELLNKGIKKEKKRKRLLKIGVVVALVTGFILGRQ